MSAQGLLNHPVVKNIQATANTQLSFLDKELSKYGFANDFEAKTKVPKVYGVLALAGTFITLIFFNLFGLASPISNIVGFVLPVYWSIAALESPGDSDDKQWLTYWISFSSLTIIESLFLKLVMYYMPFYFVFKTVLIVWLQLPSTRGATTVYNHVIKPIMAKNKSASFTPATQHDKTL